jgi:SAM-dependent methyltransferase
MNIAKRSVDFVVAFLKSYGPTDLKRVLWEKEFTSTKWDFIDNTEGDCVYPNLEKYCTRGSILDLGCGPGNTANELASTAYSKYVGVDISEAALEKGRKRTIAEGRIDKNFFVQGDFIRYEPDQKFDVILFRESIYHVPMREIKPTLDHYASYLNSDGVFIVRLGLSDSNNEKEKPRPAAMVRIMESEFEVVEKNEYPGIARPVVLVLRPRRRS